jgi:tetratricopeptide (TPR) repeat protein
LSKHGGDPSRTAGDAMALLNAFNPHELSESVVLSVATGREKPLEQILSTVRDNLAAPIKQHVIVSAPRGYGKSFFLRYVEVRIAQIAQADGLPLAMALLPEELPHVKEPDTLIAEIRRTFLKAPPETVGVRWVEDDGQAWDVAVAELDAAIEDRFGHGPGLLVAGVENFDVLVKKAFAKGKHSGRLRELLTRRGGRVMLLAASARGTFDRDYDVPLFKAFEEIVLEPWTVDEAIEFFAAQRKAAGKLLLTDAQLAKAKAVAMFISGTPRLAALIGEALLEDNPIHAADLLEKLIDELTPYYKERVDILPARSQGLLDALLRGGESCSATELARRVGAPGQSAIAAPLDDLKKDLIIVGEKAPGSAEVLHRATDRVFAHYYRKRILSHGQEVCPLEALVDLLSVLYSPEEKKREADKFAALGLAREAAIMDRLWRADQKPAQESETALVEQDKAEFAATIAKLDRVIDERRFVDGLAILDRAIKIARANGDIVGEAQALRQRAWTLGRLTRHEEAIALAFDAAAKAESAGDISGQATALRHAAWSLGQLGRHEDAIALARDAAAKAESAGDISGQATALRHAAWSLGQLGRHEEALRLARDVADKAESAGDRREQATALRRAAWSLGQLGRYEEALALARDAATMAESAGDTGGQAAALRRMAWSASQLGRYDEALALARDAAVKAESAGDLREQATALRNAAFSLGQLGRHEEALTLARDAADKAERAGDRREQAAALRRAVWNLGQLKRHEEALGLARDAATMAESAGDTGGQATALGYAAFILSELGRHEEALALARDAATKAESAGDIGEQATTLRYTAFILGELGRNDEAIALARDAATKAESSGEIEQQTMALRYAALKLGQLERYEEALALARDAAQKAEAAGEIQEQAMALQDAAWSLGQLGRHEEAIALARNAAAKAESAGNIGGQATALRNAAWSLGQLGRHEEAIALAREAAAKAEGAGDVHEHATALRNVAFNLAALGRHDEALQLAREAAAKAQSVGDIREQVIALTQAIWDLAQLGRHEEALALARDAAAEAQRAGDLRGQATIARILLVLRPHDAALALASYELLIRNSESSADDKPVRYFDDVAYTVTTQLAWLPLVALLESLPNIADRISKDTIVVGEPGRVISASYKAGKYEDGRSEARHLVSALAQAIEAARDPRLVRLWTAILDASAKEVAASIEEATLLNELADVLSAHPHVPTRLTELMAAATAYHESGRDPTRLARIDPDLATMLTTIFPPRIVAQKPAGRSGKTKKKRR